ncbi:MAG: 2-keto-3-deoxygluconate permease [Angelakisella sp.]|nr:2-keto-3-deoxygluconate permease [Angelakisella sp.]
MKNVNIIKTVQKFPGGMMVIPLLLGCIVNTFFPAFLNYGGFTTKLFSNGAAGTFVGMFIFCCGASINVRQIGVPFYKGMVLTFTKFAVGVAIGVGVGAIFGPAGIFTITPLAIIAAITNSNSVMYSILAENYGDATDVGAVSVLSLNDGPFFTMIALGLTGMGEIPIKSIIAVIIPLFIGMFLGNIDDDVRKLCEKGMPLIIPFNGFSLGAGMNLRDVVSAGIPGVVLGLVSLVSTGFICYWAYNLFFGRKRPSAVGAGVGNTAGNAVATPPAIGEADPSLAAYATTATAQVAAACVVTALLCPLLTAWLNKRIEKKYGKLHRNTEQPIEA